MKKIFLLSLAIVYGASFSFGQSQLMLYQMNSRLPQSNQINPGLFPDYKISIGLPVLSSTYVTANGGNLTFNNAFSRTADDSLHFDPQKLASNLKENNRIEVNANTQLLYLGLRLQKNYISFALNERVDFGLTYPKTFVELLGTGNGNSVGKVLAIDDLNVRAQAFHELAFGYGREITDKLSVGLRVKILSGLAGADVSNFGVALGTSLDSLYFYSNAFNVNTAGFGLFDNPTVGDVFDLVTNFANKGVALDLGAEYWITDNLNVSLSVTDLGSINWQKNTQQLQFGEVQYSFTGANLIEILDQNSNVDPLGNPGDSLLNQFEPDTLDGIGYKTKLSPKIYAGATYQLGKLHTFGATLYGDFFKGTFNPAFGISYNLQLGNIWTIGLNASYRNNSFKNIGFGTALNLGPVQLYALTENVMGLSQISDASYVDARVGMNLVFGNMRKTEKSRKPREKKKKNKKDAPVELIGVPTLNEAVTYAIAGSAEDELALGYYVVIASFSSKDEADKYNQQLVDEGYMVNSGFQSEMEQYYTYLMYYANDGNLAIDKKNELGSSFGPGLDKPWVLCVKVEEL